jgi:hypothetical protein
MTPVDAGTGQAPELRECRFRLQARAMIIISAAESAAIPKASLSVGAAACVIASSAVSCPQSPPPGRASGLPSAEGVLNRIDRTPELGWAQRHSGQSVCGR